VSSAAWPEKMQTSPLMEEGKGEVDYPPPEKPRPPGFPAAS
jgi:hypothetical protein